MVVPTKQDYIRHFKEMQQGKKHPDAYGVWTIKCYSGETKEGDHACQSTAKRRKAVAKRLATQSATHAGQSATKRRKAVTKRLSSKNPNATDKVGET